jgi:hypothetical protein
MARTKGLSTILISARLTENVVGSIGEVTKATGATRTSIIETAVRAWLSECLKPRAKR